MTDQFRQRKIEIAKRTPYTLNDVERAVRGVMEAGSMAEDEALAIVEREGPAIGFAAIEAKGLLDAREQLTASGGIREGVMRMAMGEIAPTKWEDIERDAVNDPYLHALVTMVRGGTAREEALMAVVLALSRVRASLHEEVTQGLMRCTCGAVSGVIRGRENT